MHQEILARVYGEEYVHSPQYQVELQQELGWVQQTHHAVAGAIHLYGELLEDVDPEVRVCVPYLLLSLPEYARDFLPVLRMRLQNENNPQVHASLLLTMGAFTHEHAQEYNQIFRDIARSELEASLVRLAAAIASLRLTRGSDEFSVEVMQEGIEILISSHGVKDLYDVFIGNEANLISDILEICDIRGDNKLLQAFLEDFGEET